MSSSPSNRRGPALLDQHVQRVRQRLSRHTRLGHRILVPAEPVVEPEPVTPIWTRPEQIAVVVGGSPSTEVDERRRAMLDLAIDHQRRQDLLPTRSIRRSHAACSARRYR